MGLFSGNRSNAGHFIILVVVSIALMTIDHRQNYLNDVRKGMAVLLSPLIYVVDAPFTLVRWLDNSFEGRTNLQLENKQLHTQNLLLQTQQLKLDALNAENQRLRLLLESSTGVGEKVLIAGLLAADLQFYSRRLTLDKGKQHGVYSGQPVLNAHGVVGQIVEVGLYSSIAMLITDSNHAVPVQVLRNGLRALVEGRGASNRLALPYLPVSADVQVDDLLVTSGLGGVFPHNYPVAIIKSVERNPGQTFMSISAEPLALLDSEREVLLIWPAQKRVFDGSDPVCTEDESGVTETDCAE